MNNDRTIREILSTAKTVASVGLSSSPAKESYGIVAYMQDKGYRIIPVNPTADEILGEKVYADLPSIPEKVDVVQLFRPSEEVAPFVDQAIQIGARVVWMQEGIRDDESARKAEAAGLIVVMDRCMRAEHIRLFASGLHRL
jgi:predicted CoA-binding protein